MTFCHILSGGGDLSNHSPSGVIVEYGIGNSRSNPGRAQRFFGTGIDIFILSTPICKLVWLGFLALIWQPTEKKENSEFKSIDFTSKLILCHILAVAEVLGKYIPI